MPWTKMRAIFLATSLGCTAVVGAMYVSAVAYTGDFNGHEEFWLIFFCGFLSGIGYLIAHVRDQLTEKLADVKKDIEDQSLHLAEYGDQRETAGHLTAMRVTRHHASRHLGSVDS